MHRLIIEPSFEDDFSKVLTPMHRNMPMAAEQFYDAVILQLEELKDYPLRHPVVPESPYDEMGVRWFKTGQYHVFYIITDDEIHVLRMRHIRASLFHLLER